MSKLTTIKTIKKAAPLALLAVVMSGSAFAGPGKGKGDRPKGAKLSLDVENVCELANPFNPNDPVLNLTVTIDDVSDDNGTGGGTITARTAQASVKDKGKMFDLIGPVVDLTPEGDVWTAELHLCAGDAADDALVENARAANSLVSIEVLNGDGSSTTFSTMCDDPYTDYDMDGNDDADESDISIRHLGIDCP
jgi:hypothetical protein